jgi:hypothetical protein
MKGHLILVSDREFKSSANPASPVSLAPLASELFTASCQLGHSIKIAAFTFS